jgi:hypothetical protein
MVLDAQTTEIFQEFRDNLNNAEVTRSHSSRPVNSALTATPEATYAPFGGSKSATQTREVDLARSVPVFLVDRKEEARRRE